MTRRTVAAVVGVALAVGLSGCAGSPSLDEATGARMQDGVVQIAELAAGGDIAGAASQLDALQAQLAEAVDGDLVSAARAARIQTAIDTVRADLDGLQAPAPEPEVTQPAPSPSPSEAEDSEKGDDKAKPDNSGPGSNSGKGKGKDKDD